MEIAKDVYKITGFGNLYLYLKPEPFVIDSSSPQEREKVIEEIEKIIPINKIKKVLLTHMHYDHCGNSSIFKNAKVYAHIDEINDYNKRPDLFFFDKVPKDLEKKFKKLIPLKEEINGLKVFHAPGHTRGCVYFLDEKKKLLFSGDTVFYSTIGRTDFENSLPDLMPKSVKEIVNKVEKKKLLLCPGHDY